MAQRFLAVSKRPKNSAEELRAKTPIPDIEKLPPSAALTTRQLSLVSRYAEYTLRLWRMKEVGRGPRVTYIEGHPRYLVKDVRAWMARSTSETEAA